MASGFMSLDCSGMSLKDATVHMKDGVVHNMEILKALDEDQKVDMIKSFLENMSYNKLIDTCDDVGLRDLCLYRSQCNLQSGREKRVKTTPLRQKSRCDEEENQAPGKKNKKEMSRAVPEIRKPEFKKRVSASSKIRPHDQEDDEDYVVKEMETRLEKKKREIPKENLEIPKPLKKRVSVLSKTRPRDEDEDYIVEEKEVEKRPKKMKMEKPRANQDSTNQSPESLPEEIKEKIRELGGTDVNYVYKKDLCASDVKRDLNRLSIPKKQIDTSFFTEEEKEFMKKKGGKNVPEIKVGLVGPDGEAFTTSLRMWEMRKETGKVSFIYNLTGNWSKKIVAKYNFIEKEPIQVWSFRVGQDLWFALVRVPIKS